jgi:hypothetical protein
MMTLKMIGYPFAAAVAASLAVLFLGLGVFGLQPAHWTEWQGRIVGVFGTIAGVAGAIVGWLMVLRTERRVIK